MKLATYSDGTKDGQLWVVSRDLSCAIPAMVAPTLIAALEDWDRLKPALLALSDRLNAGEEPFATVFDPSRCMAPLPRAPGWLDGSAFLTMSSLALPWLVLALVQLYRLHLGGPLHRVRLVVGGIAGAIAAVGLGSAVVLNPVLGAEGVSGPLILDTLFVAYALPGLFLLAAMRVIGEARL